MADNSILHFKCPNPDCGKIVPVKRLATGGIAKVSCPFCSKVFSVKMPEPEEKKESILDNSSAEIKATGLILLVGESAEYTCPHCGHKDTFEGSDKPCKKTLGCAKCKGRMTIEVKKPTERVKTASFPHRGKLQIVRFGFFNKDFILKIGSNVIGRADKDAPSDIEFKDETMSRRSVDLVVTINEKGGFFFELKILNATNPVLINNNEFLVGDSLMLNYGDSIVLGRTTLRFVKA